MRNLGLIAVIHRSAGNRTGSRLVARSRMLRPNEGACAIGSPAWHSKVGAWGAACCVLTL
jgi:hypothetical protein